MNIRRNRVETAFSLIHTFQFCEPRLVDLCVGGAYRQKQRLPTRNVRGLRLVPGGPLTLYLLWACLILIALALAGIVVVARRQHDSEIALLKKIHSSQASGARNVSLLESIVAALHEFELRSQELSTDLKELGTRKAVDEQDLSSIASMVERIQASQGRDGASFDEINRHLVALDGALTSTIEELDKFRAISGRRDERLIAIDATLTAISDRLNVKPSEAGERNNDPTTLHIKGGEKNSHKAA